jgi:hypothetical protein
MMMSLSRSLLGLFLAGTSLASVTVEDPSDVIDPADWAADNALLADYNVAFPSTQPSDSE